MNTERGNCAVVEAAKALAVKKGLDPSEVNCFREKTCNGLTCAYEKVPNVILVNQSDKFYEKLGKREK